MTYDAETPRLWLERLSEKHLQDFHLLWSSKESMIWSSRLPMQSIEQSQEFLRKSLTSVNPHIDKFGIMLKPEGKTGDGEVRMIGSLGTKGHVEGYGEEIAYMVHCDFWGKGYMAEALVAFAGPDGIFWGLENRKHIASLVAMIDDDNIPSKKTIAKVGGRRRERIVSEYGLARDQGPNGVVPVEKLRDVICWYVDRPKEQ